MKKYFFSAFILLTPLVNFAQSSVQVAAYTLKKEPGFHQVRTLSGQVIKQHDAKLSFEFAGKVKHIYFDQGQHVKQGDVIAQLDSQLLDVEIQKLQAQKQRIKAQRDLIKLEINRLATLDKKNYSATSALDQAKTNLAVIDAETAGIAANMNELKIRKQKSQLTAPFTGKLGQRFVSQGETVSAGTAVVRLIENNNTQVVMSVPLVLREAVNDSVEITIADQSYKAQALSKGASINPKTQTLTMRFALPNDAQVYPGQLAKLMLTQFKPQVGFWVPLDALTDGIRGTWQVYQIKSNVLEPIIIQLYYAHDGYAFIAGPLSDGDKVVANGMHKLSANIAVHIVENHNAKAL